MHAIRRRLHACTWVALLAIVGLAVGPTISRLTWHPVDAPPAMRHAAMDHAAMGHAPMHHAAMLHAAMHEAPLPTSPAHSHTLDHCALCVVALFAFAVAPPPPQVAAPADAWRPFAPPCAADSAPCRGTWSSIGARGPPALG